MPLKLKHGTHNAYNRFACRCELCRQKKSAQNAKRCHKFAYFCPNCPLGFYTDKEFKEHWKSRHVKQHAEES